MAETFDAGWLALREPVDHRSRSESLTHRLVRWWSERGGRRVLDLGSGTGSNLRYLAPRLAGPQEWTLVDHDGTLLELAQAPRPEVTLEHVVTDLAREGPARVAAADLVSASALVDLVSESWLHALVDACSEAAAGVLLALTYDGTVRWSGGDGVAATDPVDRVVLDAVNAHQGRDKGLGPALGPAGAARAETLFEARGFATRLEPSPWVLGPSDAALARALLEGWVRAATQERPDQAEAIEEWAARRRAAIDRARTRLVVGHVDLLALPPSPGSVGPSASST